MVQQFGQERFEFILNETQTRQILEDVKNRFCDLGILYLCDKNESFLRKTMGAMGLVFTELFRANPHVFLRANHPLAGKKYLTLSDLQPYPRLNFLQGSFESADYSEEPFSTENAEKIIRISDRAAIVNLMIGLDGYTISSGIFPNYLQGNSIVSVPLKEKETMHIGYVLCSGQNLSELAHIYIEALKKYRPDLS